MIWNCAIDQIVIILSKTGGKERDKIELILWKVKAHMKYTYVYCAARVGRKHESYLRPWIDRMDDAISRIIRIHMEKLCTTTPLSSTAFQRSNVQFYNQNEWKKKQKKTKKQK